MKIFLVLLALSCAGCRHEQPRFDLHGQELYVHVEPRDCKQTDKLHDVWHCKGADLMPRTVKAK